MNTVTVVGIKSVDYTSRKTGRPVHGSEIHYEYEDTRVAGIAVDHDYIAGDGAAGVSVGDNVILVRDRNGRVTGLIKA